ncbi:MAG: FAD:protein FMN transferase [Woeseiaceae bacterium]
MLRLLTICLLAVTLSLAACDSTPKLPQYELNGSTLGTSFNVLLVAPGDAFAEERLEASILETLEQVDRLASTWRDDSELSRFNAGEEAKWVTTSIEFCEAMQQVLEISALTDGAFDVTVGPLVNLWGFGPGGDVSQPPAEDVLAATIAEIGYQHLQVNCDIPAVMKQRSGIYADLSGWAKGYAVDQVAMLLDQNQLTDYLVEIGGELRVRGHNAEGLRWAVGIELPSTSRRVPHSVLRVSDTGVATSGDYRNYFDYDGKIYSHTIDARTGWPVSHSLAAVTVVNPSAAFADAMATALLVLGPTDGPKRAEQLDVAAYFLIRGETNIETVTTTSFDRLKTS